MDFIVKGTLNGETVTSVEKDVKAGAVGSIEIGDMVIPDDGNAGYVRKVADGEVSTDATRVYIAITNSTDTATADGVVTLEYAPGMIIEGTATTKANLVQAVIDTKVTVDVAAGVITVDENDTTTGFLRIARPAGGADNFDTTYGKVLVIANE